jgi:hypothetical protein
MKRIALLLLLAAGLVPGALAQSLEVGAYADYMRLSQTKTNFAGLGLRLGVPIVSHVKFEGEMSYDFNQVFTEGFTDPSSGSITIQRSNLRLLHGLFGPKVELGHSSFHPFVTLKAGFLNTRFDARPATVGTFLSSVDNLRSQDVSGILYPGGGLEGHIGPLGLRLDVGDEMYFNNGTHHNLRVAFGPYIRF